MDNYKIIKSSLIFFALVFFAFPALAASPTPGRVNTLARVRDSAGFTKVLMVLAANTPVSIIGEKGSWYEIRRKDGSSAWIAKELVDIDSDKKASVASKASTTAYKAVLNYNVNFRKEPDLKSGIIRVLPVGSTVEVKEVKNDWCAVTDKSNTNGWVSCPLISIIKNNGTDSPFSQAASLTTAKIGSVTIDDVNNYWTEKVNALRLEKKLRLLKTDDRLKKTASIWADYIGSKNIITHERPDGKSMLAWADAQDIEFTIRNSLEGWKNNYFTENIGLRLNVEATLPGIKSALDKVLKSFLSEGPAGVHYRSLYHPDWNSVGTAWYPSANKDGKYKIYFVFHYGSLANSR